jgi:hypothetical protein
MPPLPVLDIASARHEAVGSMVTIEGTVTVQAGRILGDRTLVVQDGTGGLPVRLPSVALADEYARGTILRASGELAEPYGNLELRPDSAQDLTVIGTGGQPEAIALDSGGLAERNEGLLATLRATIGSIDVYDSGAISIGISDVSGEGKVYAFAPVELDLGTLERGQRVEATGIVGQRASSSGAADGYRLWLRGTSDLSVIAASPTPTPAPGSGGSEPGADRPKRVRIADAAEGSTVTIVGIVTSKAGLIDSDARRVTVQDRSGAILVRYPADATPPRVGSVIRASGEVGTWFDARQLEAETLPRVKRRGAVRATGLRRPPAETDEWMLVRVSVRIADVERDGDTWRAEAELSDGSTLPIVGLAGSGIEGDLLESGRSARITGLVKRAHPSATDQRFGVAPRSRRDIRLGRLQPSDEEAVGGPDDVADGDDPDVYGVASVSADSGVFAATLGSLDGLQDRLVRVGGRVEAVAERRLTIDDGTATGTVRLADTALPVDPEFRIGEVVNAVGRVRRHRARGPEVVVESVADVRRAASLLGSDDSLAVRDTGVATGRSPSAVPVDSDGSERPPEGFVPGPALLLLGAIGLASLALLGAAGFIAWSSTRPAKPTRGEVMPRTG